MLTNYWQFFNVYFKIICLHIVHLKLKKSNNFYSKEAFKKITVFLKIFQFSSILLVVYTNFFEIFFFQRKHMYLFSKIVTKLI